MDTIERVESALDERILILAPIRKDGPLIANVLESIGIDGVVCADLDDMARRFIEGAGALVLTEEALDLNRIGVLSETLRRQEPWSDIPIVVLTSDGEPIDESSRGKLRVLNVFNPSANVLFVERPCRVMTLTSTLQMSLRSRRRQYEIRDLLRQRDENLRQLARQTDELRRSNAELEHFAYLASHDLQEPLRMISSYIELLRKRYAEMFDERAMKYFHYVREGATRMSQLIHALLEYSRVGQGSYRKEPLLSEAVVRDALDNLHSKIAERGAEVELGNLPEVIGNPIELTQLFQNLIGNAVKFCPSDRIPRVNVDAREDGESWLWRIADNGIGIDPIEHERIFRLFQRLHAVDAYPGTGIGLAMCKKIVERHGGSIWVESEPGRGSTFWFRLPR
jgi:signal transduction histidine kinase